MFLRMFRNPGESLKKCTLTFVAICDAINLLVSIVILISITIRAGILGFFIGVIVSGIFFLLYLVFTRFFYLLYYCWGEMASRLKSIDEKIEAIALADDDAVGEEIEKTQSTERVCANCGMRTNSEAKFCSGCGTAVR